MSQQPAGANMIPRIFFPIGNRAKLKDLEHRSSTHHFNHDPERARKCGQLVGRSIYLWKMAVEYCVCRRVSSSVVLQLEYDGHELEPDVLNQKMAPTSNVSCGRPKLGYKPQQAYGVTWHPSRLRGRFQGLISECLALLTVRRGALRRPTFRSRAPTTRIPMVCLLESWRWVLL